MLTPRGRRILLLGLAAVGYALCGSLLIQHGLYTEGGAGGGDIFAYWTAGRHLVAGETLYQSGVGGYAAFLYPPPLAQAFIPLALMPFWVCAWIWRVLLLIALRITVGSWRNAGLALLLWPPLVAEMDAGNVHLLLAAATAEAIRGHAHLLAPVAVTKFATVAAAPMGLFHNPRSLALGALLAAGLAGASAIVAPDLWIRYVQFALSAPASVEGWYNIGDHVPGLLRFGSAAALALLAIRWRRLAAVAVTLALPVLWLHGLSTLVALVATPPGTAARSDHPSD